MISNSFSKFKYGKRVLFNKSANFISYNREIKTVKPQSNHVTIGSYLAQRLVEAGLSHYFTVPGDYTLGLLDELLKEPKLSMISCCNELNAGYAADGLSRATNKISAICVTYMVGGLSALNAVAGAYSDNIPLFVISGGPNSNDGHERHIIHHSIGEIELYQQSKCYDNFVVKSFSIRHPDDAARMIDESIALCVTHKLPVYLELPVNLATFKIDAPTPMSKLTDIHVRKSDQIAMDAAAAVILNCISASVKPVLVAGVKLRAADAKCELVKLADSLQCGVAVMPDAKSLFPESHSCFMGRYWGGISSQCVIEIVSSSDLVLYVGPVFNDYNTVGWTEKIWIDKTIIFGEDYVNVCGRRYNNVYMKDILTLLANMITTPKTMSLNNFRRYYDAVPHLKVLLPNPCTMLSLKYLMQCIQQSLTSQTSIIAETGDSWFIGEKLHIPDGCQYHVQMQYGSVGWSVGALLGVGLAWRDVQPNRKIMALIGDGSFQMSAQELSTIIRYNINATIFLINNDGYTVDVQIHDGPYNDIAKWDYSGIMNIFSNGVKKNGQSYKVKTCGELLDAMKKSEALTGVTLIEVLLPRDDCTAELLEWSNHVAVANRRPHSSLIFNESN
eukprot:gene12492-16758_t